MENVLAGIIVVVVLGLIAWRIKKSKSNSVGGPGGPRDPGPGEDRIEP